jgi:hypothetical protein
LLLIAEAFLLFGGIILAVYLRLGSEEAQRQLLERHGCYIVLPA